MKNYLLMLCIFFTTGSIAQNVGVGTPTPSEKLDVNGNLNVQGTIKMNSVSGANNQVLMTNGSGATVWADLSGYKNIVSYTQTDNWTVPAGVTSVVVEMWGGGGGGASGGGGGGGTYVITGPQTVTPGNAVNIVVGAGGAGAVGEGGNGGAGGFSQVSLGASTFFQALGGSGANFLRGGGPSSYGLDGDGYLQYPGQSGTTTTFEYAQRTAGQFVEVRKYGNGGGTAPAYNNGGPGGTVINDLSTTINIKITQPGFTQISGTGGGGGSAGSGNWGADGSKGMVIIHY